MDGPRRGIAGRVPASGVDEAFWAIVDANWTADELSFLVLLWKTFEDRLRSRPTDA